MPKRRTRTAAQINASRKNLIKARNAKARKVIPRTEYGTKLHRGPMLTLFHATTAQSAKDIRKNGFTWKEGRSLSMSGVKDPIWFNTKPPKAGSSPADWVHEKFGGKKVKPVLFSVRVRMRKTHRDKHVPSNSQAIPSRVVSAEYLRGKKIRRL
jgi:hypothetical protein